MCLFTKILTTTKTVIAMSFIVMALSACNAEHRAPHAQPNTYHVPHKTPATDTASNILPPPPAEECIPLIVMAGAIDAITPRVAKGVTVDSQCNILAEETVMCHPHLMGIAIAKLLDNAAKFTKQGSILLTLDHEGDKMHLAVPWFTYWRLCQPFLPR